MAPSPRPDDHAAAVVTDFTSADDDNQGRGTAAAPIKDPVFHLSHEGEHHGDYGNVPVAITKATYLFAMCASVNSCNLGYDIGVSTQAGRLLQEDFGLTIAQRELFTGSINFWAMFGALFAQYFTDRFGRRTTFIVAAIGFIFGVVIQSCAQSFGVLLLGRIFVGLGVGVGLAIDPMYIAEVSPAKHRGELVTWSEISINIGLVFGFSTGLLFASMDASRRWRVMFALGGILPCLMIVLVLTIMPESPRWLVSKRRIQEAKQVLEQIYPPGFDVNLLVADIQEALAREEAAEKHVGWGVILYPTPAFRRMLLVGIGTAVGQQFAGIEAIQYYLIDVLEGSGIQSYNMQQIVLIFLGLLKLGFIVVAGKLFDSRGRRPLLFTSLIGMAGALLMISLAFFFGAKVKTGFTVFGLALYLSFFSIGMGPGAWLIPSEVFSIVIRAKAMSLAAFGNRATALLMSTRFLSVQNRTGWAGFFFILTLVCLVVFAFLYVYLPETKGRSLEDMSLYFAEITGDTSVLEAEILLTKDRPEVAGPVAETKGDII